MLESKTIFGKVLEDKEQVQRLRYNRLLESAKVGDKPFDKKFSTNINVIWNNI